MKEFFDENSVTILVTIKSEVVDDPEENNKTLTKNTNKIPIKAVLIGNVKPEQLQWKFYGKEISEARVMFVENNKLSMLKLSHSIEISGVTFEGYKDATNRFSILPLNGEDYSQITVFRK